MKYIAALMGSMAFGLVVCLVVVFLEEAWPLVLIVAALAAPAYFAMRKDGVFKG